MTGVHEEPMSIQLQDKVLIIDNVQAWLVCWFWSWFPCAILLPLFATPPVGVASVTKQSNCM